MVARWRDTHPGEVIPDGQILTQPGQPPQRRRLAASPNRSELTGKGEFEDFVWYGLSSTDTYDGRAIIIQGDEERRARLRCSPADNDLSVIEFKMRGASIARDFDRDEKDPRKVDLVICYEVGTPPVSGFQVVEIEDSETHKSGQHTVKGVTHVLYDTASGREVPLLPLQNYVAKAFPPGEPPDLPASVEDAD